MNVPDQIRGLLQVVRISSALSLGAMAAFLYSVKQVTPGFRCELTPGTGVAFMLGALFSWAYWRVAFQTGSAATDARRRIHFGALSLLLVAVTVVAFALALKGVGNQKLREVVQGTLIAVFALGCVGFLFWRVTRFLERDSRREAGSNGATQEHPESPGEVNAGRTEKPRGNRPD